MYASVHWLDHAKFENVRSQIQDALKHLFNPKRPHLRACIWMHNVENKLAYLGHSAAEQPPPLKATPLYYAVFCGFSELAKWLIATHAEDVNAKCYHDRTPLHVASQEGHVDAVHVLLDHGAHVNSQDHISWTPLHWASQEGSLKVVQLLLEHEATLNAQTVTGCSPIYLASQVGHIEVVRLLGDRGADVHIQGFMGSTPFRAATQSGHHDVAQLLLEYGAKREGDGGSVEITDT
jgi:ankyrin repeat protein